MAKAFGLELGDKLMESGFVVVWRARVHGADSKEVALHVLSESAPRPVQDRFAIAVSRASGLDVPGVLRVHEVSASGDAFVSDLWTTGTAQDLPALRWSLRRRLEFLRRAAEALDAMHRAELIHGALTADGVLLDDDLHPVLTGMGLAPADAPEPDVGTDIVALGRLIEQIVGADSKPDIDDIVRQCSVRVAELRYPSVSAVVSAIKTAVDRLPAGESAGIRPSTPPPSSLRTAEPVRSPRSGKLGKAIDRWARRFESSGQLRIAVGVLGVLLLAGSLAAGFFSGGGAVLHGVTLLGAVLTTWLVPSVPRARALARVGLVVTAATVVIVADPLGRMCRVGAMRRLHGAGDAATRASIAEILRLDRDLHGARLAGTDLSGLDLSGVDLRGADLAHVDLSRSRLFGALLGGASLDGAKLAGADLQRSTLDGARDTQTASCDGETRLPSGWRCSAGLLASGAARRP
jgi:tRNA A-37 threonylcarbamoyl transferase component Bud32